jgi:hypothetical protein
MASPNSLSSFTAVAPRSVASFKASLSLLVTRSAVSARDTLVEPELEALEFCLGLVSVKDGFPHVGVEVRVAFCFDSEDVRLSEDMRGISTEALGNAGKAPFSSTGAEVVVNETFDTALGTVSGGEVVGSSLKINATLASACMLRLLPAGSVRVSLVWVPSPNDDIKLEKAGSSWNESSRG